MPVVTKGAITNVTVNGVTGGGEGSRRIKSPPEALQFDQN